MAMITKGRTSIERTWTDGSSVERAAYSVAAVLFVSGLVHFGVLVFLGTTWEGPVSYPMLLAGGGAVIVVTVLAFTVAALRPASGLPPSLLLALRFGLVVLTGALAVGAVMIADGVSLARGGEPQLAYTTAGGLKPVHAVTMHAILLVPGLAWLLRFVDWPERRRTTVIWTVTGLYTAVIAAVWALFG